MGSSPLRPVALVLALASVLGFGVAARADGESAPATHARVVERDFRIAAPKSAAAGELLLTVVNRGPDNHELVIVRKTGARLPLRSDGLTVDEDALHAVMQRSLEPGPPNSTRTLRVRLLPGRYVLFCNMTGHFLAGMRTELVVR